MTLAGVAAARDDPDAAPATIEPVGPREARSAALAALLFLVPLPLQWQVLAVTPLGVVRWFHFGALAMAVLYLLTSARLHGVVRELVLLVAAMTLMTVLCVVSAVVYSGDVAQPVQHLAYFTVTLLLATVLVTAMSHDAGRRLLGWAAPLAVGWSLWEFERNLRASGVNPLAQVRQAVLAVDPHVLIFGVFRKGFSTSDTLEPASIRHEVMAAILVAILVTLVATRLRPWVAALAGVAVALGALVILLSLSRAVLLAVVLAVLIAASRAFVRLSLSRTASVVLAAGVLVLLLGGARIGPLLYSRLFSDSGSYQARFESFALPTGEVGNRLLSGGPDLLVSTHTLFFDVLFRTGWLGGLSVVVVLIVILRYAVEACRRYFVSRSIVDLVAITASALVLTRSFTTGNGYLHQTEWAAFGLVVAISWLRRPGASPAVGAQREDQWACAQARHRSTPSVRPERKTRIRS